MKTLTDCIRQTTKSDEPWAVEWACQTIVCSDVKEYLCRVGAPIMDAMLFELAAQAVNFVDHFEPPVRLRRFLRASGAVNR